MYIAPPPLVRDIGNHGGGLCIARMHADDNHGISTRVSAPECMHYIQQLERMHSRVEVRVCAGRQDGLIMKRGCDHVQRDAYI